MKDILHCYPVNDLKDHATIGLACECRPRVEHHPEGVLVIHNSWDGREILEEALKHIENPASGN